MGGLYDVQHRTCIDNGVSDGTDDGAGWVSGESRVDTYPNDLDELLNMVENQLKTPQLHFLSHPPKMFWWCVHIAPL